MTVGALLDAGAPAAALIDALKSLETGAKFEVEKTRRGGVTASKFRVIVPAQAPTHRHLNHILGMIDKVPANRSRQTKRLRCVSALRRSRSPRPRPPRRKSPLPRSRSRRFHRRHRRRLRSARPPRHRRDPHLSHQRRQRHRQHRTRHAPRPRPRHSGTARRQAHLRARPRRRAHHAHRSRPRRHALRSLRRAPRHEHFEHRLWRRRPRFQRSTQRPSRPARRPHHRHRSHAGQRDRSQHRRFQPPSSRLRAGAFTRSRRPGRIISLRYK